MALGSLKPPTDDAQESLVGPVPVPCACGKANPSQPTVMTAVVHRGALIGFLTLTVACGTERPTAPSSTQPPSTTPPAAQPPAPSPPAGQPPLTGPATTYLFSAPLAYQVRSFTSESRYVLYDNGAFGLMYAAFDFTYAGTYWRVGRDIYFDFGTDGLWDASGTLEGDVMEVRYSVMMEHSDFENAVYKRSREP